MDRQRLFSFVVLLLVQPFLIYGLMNDTITEVENSGKYSVAYVTVPNTDVGRTIARGLVQEKLAACVNIMPKIMSIYYWDNKINEDEESLLMIKTRTSEMERVINYVKSNHPYEVCEVISTPITQGNPDYLQWIGKNVPES